MSNLPSELSKQEDIEIESPNLPFEPFIKVGSREEIGKEYKSPLWKQNLDSTNNPFLENQIQQEIEYQKGAKESNTPAFPPSSTEASTPSTQRSIPPPTVQPERPTYIVTTTTENPSPTRRVHSIHRLVFLQYLQSSK